MQRTRATACLWREQEQEQGGLNLGAQLGTTLTPQPRPFCADHTDPSQASMAAADRIPYDGVTQRTRHSRSAIDRVCTLLKSTDPDEERLIQCMGPKLRHHAHDPRAHTTRPRAKRGRSQLHRFHNPEREVQLKNATKPNEHGSFRLSPLRIGPPWTEPAAVQARHRIRIRGPVLRGHRFDDIPGSDSERLRLGGEKAQ